VGQILVFNAINTIVTDMEGNIRIDILPWVMVWTVKLIFLSPPA
jgi:hypothetical protein